MDETLEDLADEEGTAPASAGLVPAPARSLAANDTVDVPPRAPFAERA